MNKLTIDRQTSLEERAEERSETYEPDKSVHQTCGSRHIVQPHCVRTEI